MIRRFLAPLSILLLLFAIPAALATGGGYGNDPCDEYHETRHPECQSTTSTYQSSTTTQPEVTTTQPEVTTTTVEQQETTTTTAAPCAPGLTHQPPLCVNPSTTVPEVEVSSTVVSAVILEELPFTGLDTSFLALGSSVFLTAGLGLLAWRRRVEG